MKSRRLTSMLLACASIATGLLGREAIQQPRETQAGAAETGQAHEVKPNPIFSEIIPRLLQKTHVPLRLPEYVPYTDDKETPLFGILEVAEPENYSIQLAWTNDCEGGNACHVGHIGASKAPLPHEDKPEGHLTLRGGIKGSFVGFDCGAHCDDASIYWTEGDYHYGISLKAGDKKTLVRMANSAIAGGSSNTPKK